MKTHVIRVYKGGPDPIHETEPMTFEMAQFSAEVIEQAAVQLGIGVTAKAVPRPLDVWHSPHMDAVDKLP